MAWTRYPFPFLWWIHYDLLQGLFESWTLVGMQTIVKYWLEPKICTGSALTCPFSDTSLESRSHSSKIVSIWPTSSFPSNLCSSVHTISSYVKFNKLQNRDSASLFFNIIYFLKTKQTFKPCPVLAQFNYNRVRGADVTLLCIQHLNALPGKQVTESQHSARLNITRLSSY